MSWETGEEKGDDKIGDYRPWDVPYERLEHLEPNPDKDPEIKASNDARKARNDVRKENKSYIDNPDIQALTFLNPRRYIFGIKINF